MRIRVEVYDKRLRTRLAKLERGFEKESFGATQQIAEIVKTRAKVFAPKDTGRTSQFISKWVEKNYQGNTVIAVGFINGGFNMGNPHPLKKWRGDEFSLPVWMHTSPRAKSFPWRSGTPNFLDKAANSSRNDFRREVETRINRLIKK